MAGHKAEIACRVKPRAGGRLYPRERGSNLIQSIRTHDFHGIAVERGVLSARLARVVEQNKGWRLRPAEQSMSQIDRRPGSWHGRHPPGFTISRTAS